MESLPKKQTLVNFYRQLRVGFGRAVFVTGNILELGAWDRSKAFRLTWTDNDNWIGVLNLSQPCEFEFRYFIGNYDNPGDMSVYQEEPGQNFRICSESKLPIVQDRLKSSEIKAMSYNIRYANETDGEHAWSKRKKLAAEVALNHCCDFIGMQEALFEQLTEFQSQLPMYNWYGRGRYEREIESESCPIFYLHEKWELEEGNTFWLSNKPEKPSSTSYGNKLPRVCTWARFKNRETGIKFTVYNTHLDHESGNAQKSGSIQIKEFVAAKQENDPNFLICGDFNVGRRSTAVDIIANYKLKLQDTYKSKDFFTGTFHGFYGVTLFHIDYIFVAPELKVLSYEIIKDSKGGIYPSDHFPIKAAFLPKVSN